MPYPLLGRTLKTLSLRLKTSTTRKFFRGWTKINVNRILECRKTYGHHFLHEIGINIAPQKQISEICELTEDCKSVANYVLLQKLHNKKQCTENFCFCNMIKHTFPIVLQDPISLNRCIFLLCNYF